MRIKTKLIIFDFDGVLADSFDTFYPFMRDGMKKIGFSFTKNQYRNLFIGNVHQELENFINDRQKLSAFLKFRKDNYDKYYYGDKNKVNLFPEALFFLKKISRKYILTIASSGYQKNVEDLLETNKIRELFGLIIANTSTTKENAIKEILKKFKVKPKEVVMVTDTVGDLKVAKKVGLKTIAVTWGFHSPKLLKTAKPDQAAGSFKELAQKLKVH